MKHCLCSTPILALLNLQQPFEIEIDSLDYVVGVVHLARSFGGLSQ